MVPGTPTVVWSNDRSTEIHTGSCSSNVCALVVNALGSYSYSKRLYERTLHALRQRRVDTDDDIPERRLLRNKHRRVLVCLRICVFV